MLSITVWPALRCLSKIGMQRNGEMCFLGSPESAEMKKLEELVNVMFCHLL